jgi:predicted GIY-YIG superfamily endonuclease
VTNRKHNAEYPAAWEKRDASANRFFVYILKLDGGEFYAGHTRELRERLSEHRDGRTKSTAELNPKLVWFGMLATREAAIAAEAELKKLVDSNPREVRRMVIDFQDLARELDYS